MVLVEVPAQYGWVALGAGIGTWVTGMVLSSAVMKARAQYNVPYPNLYAVPGYHKNADEFNRVQRSHQHYLEGLGAYVTLALIGGVKVSWLDDS